MRKRKGGPKATPRRHPAAPLTRVHGVRPAWVVPWGGFFAVAARQARVTGGGLIDATGRRERTGACAGKQGRKHARHDMPAATLGDQHSLMRTALEVIGGRKTVAVFAEDDGGAKVIAVQRRIDHFRADATANRCMCRDNSRDRARGSTCGPCALSCRPRAGHSQR